MGKTSTEKAYQITLFVAILHSIMLQLHVTMHTHACMHAPTHIHTHTHTRTHIYTHIHTRTRTHIYTHTYTHTHSHAHTLSYYLMHAQIRIPVLEISGHHAHASKQLEVVRWFHTIDGSARLHARSKVHLLTSCQCLFLQNM